MTTGFYSRGLRFGLGRLTVSRGFGPIAPQYELLELPKELPGPTIQPSQANRAKPRILSVAKKTQA
jgi:hypothetical protein